ncbi:AlpA family phage regulatory protein [Geomonas terrae]|uniref:AlpA family phage regulatory protein n=1 Tax=Geomonas terrae TaxID=2562681 RepID=A0A4S1CMT0_9BACT|nr:AlpA family phage regulatory protein [Geomonas terrae]
MGTETDRIVRESERAQITGRSASQWRRDEAAGNAPLRVRLGAKAVGWKLSELLNWVSSRQSVTVIPGVPYTGKKRGRPAKNHTAAA